VLSAQGRATVRYPLGVERGERYDLRIALPAAAALPEGYVYVPPGRFLYGTAEDEYTRRNQRNAQPIHAVQTGGYLIGRTPVTFADWLLFLRALPAEERQRRSPHISNVQGAIELRELPGGAFELVLRPTTLTYMARSGEKLRYPGRKRHKEQD